MEDSILTDNGYGIYCNLHPDYSNDYDSSIIIKKNIFYRNNRGIYLLFKSGNLKRIIQYNTVAHNTVGVDIGQYNSSNPCDVTGNNIIGNGTGLSLRWVHGTRGYNNVWGNSTDYAGYTDNIFTTPAATDISQDPLFVDDENDNYGLLNSSPCIDSGDPNSPLDPDETRADIGALYFNQIILADTDEDGVSDTNDLCPDTPQDETVDENGCSASQKDSDNDGYFDDVDNCIDTPNENQADLDNDGIGDACDSEYNRETDNNLDEDGDGMLDEWELQYSEYNGGSGLDPYLNDADGDLDGDGVSNIDEINGGSEPNNPESIPNYPPSKPELISPCIQDDETAQISAINVSFQWYFSIDPEDDIIKYKIILIEDGSDNKTTIECENVVIRLADKAFYYLKTPLSPGTKYWWSVIAVDENDNESEESEACSFTTMIDSDGDGICDDWEIYGIKDSDGNVVLNLPAMGADPQHKDVFIEVDYTYNPEKYSDNPQKVIIEPIVEAFKNAPGIDNPDGNPGINLHVDYGKNRGFMLPDDNEAIWDSLSKSNGFRNPRLMSDLSGIDESIPPLFKFFIDDNNKTIANKSEYEGFKDIVRENFDSSRHNVFHYCLFTRRNIEVYKIVDGVEKLVKTPSGVALDNFFVVNLGDESSIKEAGTFMHELGHSLGLGHGGPKYIGGIEIPDCDVNFKPNYLSVMNYLFQNTGLIKDSMVGPFVFEYGYFDYSRFEIDYLNENSLNESLGIQCQYTDLSDYSTLYFPDSISPDDLLNSDEPIEILKYAIQIGGCIDWNNDKLCESTIPPYDINKNGESSDVLYSYNDWINLNYSTGLIGKFGQNIEPEDVMMISTPDIDQLSDNILLDFEVASSESRFLEMCNGESMVYEFSVKNSGISDDSYIITIESKYGFENTQSLPETIALSSGSAISFDIPIEIPENVNVFGETELIKINVQSQNQSNILDSSEITIEFCNDSDGDNFAEQQGDCDDTNPAINPDATEIPNNGIDEDCDGEDLIDESLLDQDEDGFTPVEGDCDDFDYDISPEAEEVCDDGIDNNCDGEIDEGCVIPGDLDGDGDVDRYDVNVIKLHVNQLASVCPDCDIDGDGTITVLDARKLMLMCTCESCVCP